MSSIVSVRVKGVEKATEQLRQLMAKHKGGTQRAVAKIALTIRGEAVERAPIVTGNLRASAFVAFQHSSFGGVGSSTSFDDRYKTAAILRAEQVAAQTEAESMVRADKHPAAIVGFSAFYALFVHEDGVTRNWTGVKFLERAITENMWLYRSILVQEMRA